ncbi:MAG: S8 family serine peptidase [Verrucomicrobiia bacterium]|jgi:subtilisin family serine protease
MTFSLTILLRKVLIACIGVMVAAATGYAATEYVEGEALVTFKEAADLPAARQALQKHTLSLAKHFKELSEHRHRQTGLVRWRGHTTAALIDELKQDASVETVEPNYLRWATASVPTNCALFAQQWGLQNTGQVVNGAAGTAGDDIRFVSAWSLAQPAAGAVVVAVIDTGVDYTHPDLVSNMWTNAGEIPGNGVDDDGNGYVDDYYGYDFADNLPDPMDSGLHGTHVSGTIAATGIPSGVVGVNNQAKIMALKASSDGNTLSDDAVIEAIQYATMMKGRGVNIVAINASFGGGGQSVVESAAIQSAGDAGIIFCAAAGNDSVNNDTTPTYPASYRLPNMIVVAASDQNDALASFSNYGITTVDLAAPGVNILSTIPIAVGGTTAAVSQASVTYAANGLTYAGITTGITATVYDCGTGTFPGNFPAGVNGNIALIERGTSTFSTKVSNAMAAGARAAIIYNNVTGNFQGTLQYSNNWIPAVSISQADGQTLQSQLPTTVTVVNSRDPTQIYQYLDGTSMATPHVAGAVAFAAMNYPAETVAQRIQRILANVDAVAGLQTRVQTGGRLNLSRTVTAIDTNPPAVSITSPADGAIYTRAQTVTLTASASDDTGVTKVEFYDTGTLKATDTTTPYTYTWRFTSADDGAHDWTARAYDAAGNVATSAVVTLTVNIPVPCGGSANRTAPQAYVAGSANHVTISVVPNNTVSSYSLTDTPPSGWSVTNIDNGGSWDSVNQQVTWGPFADYTPRSLDYDVLPPADTTGVQCFAGTVSFDTSSCAVTGNDCISPVPPVTCAYAVSPSSATFGTIGGSGNVNVTTDGGCAWTATSRAGWLTITTGNSGTGNGTVSYSVAANTGATRSGTLTIAGHSVTVSQASGCTYAGIAGSTNMPVSGGTGSINVTTSASCDWSAASTAPAWLHVGGTGTGTGTGMVNYTVDANANINARTGAIVVQGRVFTVNQAPVICTYTLAAPGTNMPARGGSGTVTVNVASPCPWVAISNTDWLQTASNGTGTGTGSVQFTVAANTTTNARTGTLTVQNQSFIVSQPPEHSPVIIAGPVITNALLSVFDLAVVPAGTNLAFLVTATDADGDPLTYQWAFGDGTGSTEWMPWHTYETNTCGTYTATVVVADGVMPSPTGTLHVAVACQLNITHMQLKPNFARRNADSCTLRATFVPGADFGSAGQPVTVDIGDGLVNFVLNKAGHGAGTNGTCTVSYNKGRGWTIAFALKAGAWHQAWTGYDLLDATIKKGVKVQVPVIVVIGNDAYAADQPLTYTATAGKSGTAK